MAQMLFVLAAAILLGFGALQELVVRGIWDSENQAFWLGLAGSLVCLLVVVATIALWRGRPFAPHLAWTAAVASVAFHLYGVLPPHHNVGMVALLLALSSGILLARSANRARRRIAAS